MRPANNDMVDTFFCAENDVFYSSGTYTPLNVENSEIRLLEIIAGSEDDQVCCKMVTARLGLKRTRYHALSYAAGDLNDTVKAKIEDVEFNIFRSIDIAMRHLRSNGIYLVWIDQVCINQSDHVEKQQQVMLLKRIYTEAEQVVLWLGEESEDGDAERAMAFLRSLNDEARRQGAVNNLNYDEDEEYEASAFLAEIADLQERVRVGLQWSLKRAQERSLGHQIQIHRRCAERIVAARREGELTREIKSATRLFAAPWWERCWTLQEVVVATHAEVRWGSHSISWPDFEIAFRSLSEFYQQTVLGVVDGVVDMDAFDLEDLGKGVRFTQLKAKWEGKRNLHLREVLNISRSLKSTDPRDRVYAMLGLADHKYNLVPDYATMTPASVFVAAAKASIEHDQCLDILADANEVDRDASLNLPSWVPDFSRRTGRFSLAYWEHDGAKSGYDASMMMQLGAPKGSSLRGTRLYEPKVRFVPFGENSHQLGLLCHGIKLGVVASPEALVDCSQVLAADEGADGAELGLNAKTFLRRNGMELEDMYAGSDQSVKVAFAKTFNSSAVIQEEYQASARKDRLGELYLSGKWKFFVTPGKLMGLAPSNARHDDRIMILLGASVPFIVRPVQGFKEPAYELVGPCYLYGNMFGEVFGDVMRGEESRTEREMPPEEYPNMSEANFAVIVHFDKISPKALNHVRRLRAFKAHLMSIYSLRSTPNTNDSMRVARNSDVGVDDEACFPDCRNRNFGSVDDLTNKTHIGRFVKRTITR